MSVRAKMQCVEVKELGEETKQVRLCAVYEDGNANKEWSKWTPYGEVVLGITNPAAFSQFEQGKVYYVDFNLTEDK